jgi:acetyl esterase/lipase
VWCNAGAAQGVERELAYAPGSQQRLDLAIPATKRFPTVLFVHGGGLTTGDKSDGTYLASQGLKILDLRGVIAMVSIMWDVEFEQALKQYGRERAEAAFQQDPENRMYANLDSYLDHWPIRHVKAGLPPFLFLIAESEQQQPPVLETNKKFVEDARAKGNWAEYKVLPGRTHYSAIRKLAEPADPTFLMVRDFVRRFSKGDRP